MRTALLPRQVDPTLSRVFNILKAVAAESLCDAPLRVAGGWVRDAIMMRDSNDVDIAIETPPVYHELITGAKFASLVVEYVSRNPGLVPGDVGTMSVIKTNPEQSKHIETAQLKLLGVPLEFCHLRQDDYTNCNDNRLPSVRPGTPLEDALRRDFTCNALFYNIQQGVVEDYCGGLSDIDSMVLRCPLHPFETFFDDPLRILRGVRFLGQLDFHFHDSVIAAFHEVPSLSRYPQLPYPYTVDAGPLHPLCTALIVKVSRERGGIELTKMLTGAQPYRCTAALLELGILFSAVLVEAHYTAKPKVKNAKPDILAPVVVGDDRRQAAAPRILAAVQLLSRIDTPDSHDRMAIMLCALMLVPLDHDASNSPTLSGFSTSERIQGCIIRWLRLPTRHADFVQSVSAALDHIRPILPTLIAAAQSPEAHALQGAVRTSVYRALCALQSNSRQVPAPHAVLCALSLAILSSTPPDTDAQQLAAQAESVATLLVQDSAGALMRACVAAPLIRGDQLSAFITVPRSQIGHVLELQREYMLHNPDCEEAQLVQYLRTVYPPAKG